MKLDMHGDKTKNLSKKASVKSRSHRHAAGIGYRFTYILILKHVTTVRIETSIMDICFIIVSYLSLKVNVILIIKLQLLYILFNSVHEHTHTQTTGTNIYMTLIYIRF